MDQSNSSESIIDRDNHMIVDYPIESETTDINEVLKEQAVGHKSDPSKIKVCDEFIESENKAKFELRNCQKSQYLLVQELRKLKSEAEIREDLLERGNEGFFIAENQKIKDENDALKNQIEGFKNEIYVLNSKYEGMEIEHKAKIKELREHFDDKIQKQLNDSQNVIKYLKESIEEINEEMKKRDLLCADAKKSLHERNLEVKEFKEINSMLQKKMAILKNKETQHEKKITFQESKIKDLNILNKNLKLDKESAQTLLNKSERDLETVIKEKEEQEAKYKELESNFKGTRQRNQELKILSEKRKREIERLCKCNPSNENDKNVSEWFKEKLERVEKREEELRIECGKKENEFKLRINEIKSEIKKLENSKIKLNHKNKELEMTVEGLKNAVKKKDEELYHLDNDYYHELTDKKKCEKMLIKKTKELKILHKRAFIFETEQREFRKKCAIKKTDTEKWINKNRTLTHGYKNHQKMRILREKELELSKLGFKKLQIRYKKLENLNKKTEEKLSYYHKAYLDLWSKDKDNEKNSKEKDKETERLLKTIDHMKMEKDHAEKLCRYNKERKASLEKEMNILQKTKEHNSIDCREGPKIIRTLKSQNKILSEDNKRLTNELKKKNILKMKHLQAWNKINQLRAQNTIQAELLTTPINIHQWNILEVLQPELSVYRKKTADLTKKLINLQSCTLKNKIKTVPNDEPAKNKCKTVIPYNNWLAKKNMAKYKENDKQLQMEIQIKSEIIENLSCQLEKTKQEINNWKTLFYKLKNK